MSSIVSVNVYITYTCSYNLLEYAACSYMDIRLCRDAFVQCGTSVV